MDATPPSATFRILGPLEVVDPASGLAVDLGGPKQRAVLARLLLSPGVVVPVDRLVDALWGDSPPASAAGTLQAYVSNLRKALEPARPSGEAPSVLVTQAPGYLLAIDPSAVDATAFEALVAAGAEAVRAASWDAAVESLSTARALWRGPALAEPAFERFAGAEVARLSELRLQGLEWWAEALLGAGHHAEVVPDLGREVAEHPLRPRLRAALMLALYRSGRQADALRVYRDGRAVLRDELGAEPEPELQALEEQILLQDPALDWRPSGASASPASVIDAAAGEGEAEGDVVSPLVGRDAERAAAERALITAASGRGSVILVAGEAGIGKTRLAEEVVAAAAERGAAVAWGRSFESEGTPAFWPWVDVLRQLLPPSADELAPLLAGLGADAGFLVRLLPELASVVPPVPATVDDADEAVRFSLYGAVTRVIEAVAERRPVVVVLDDAHWADAASLRLLRFLGPHVAAVRVLVVVTYREDEIGGELGDALAGLAREAEVTRLELVGLTEGDVGRLLTDTLAEVPTDSVIRDVAARSAGNPFFVGELARLIGGGGDVRAVPPGVRDVIRRRIDRLPAGADRLLSAAAVGGREFDVDIAAVVAELDPDDDATLDLVEAALDAHLLVETGRLGRYRFTHALVQEALLGSLSGLRRARMHQRIADVLAARSPTGRAEDLAELAIHALEGAAGGGSVTAAVGHAREAADAALAALAFEQAASLCARALELLDEAGAGAGGDDEVRFALALDLGIARRREGDVDGARSALRVALASARALGDAERFARAAVAFGGGAWWGWWNDVGFVDTDAVAAYEEALDRLGPSASALRVEVLGRLAVELHFDEAAADRREALSASALAEARALVAEGADVPSSRRALVHALATRHIAVWRPGNADERRALADELVAIARSVRASEAEAFGHHFLFLAALERGDVAGAEVQLEEGERLVRLLPLPHLIAQVAWSRSLLAAVAGRFDDAEALQGVALETTARWSEAEAMRTWSAQLAGLRWDQGRGIELAEPLRHRIAVEAINVNWKTGLALLLADAGEVEEATSLFDDVAASAFDDIPTDLGRLFNLAVRALTCLLLEDRARAAQLLPLLEPYAGGHVVQATRLVYAGPVSFLVGGLRLLTGDVDGGLALLRQARSEADRMGARPFGARARLALARGLEDDAPDEARALATEALATAEELGMVRLAARTAELLDRLP